MANTEHLPIYKSSYDLCLYLEQVVQGFSRYHKYSLGTDLRDGGRRVLKLVVRANARYDKAPVLLELREELEELKVLLRLGPPSRRFLRNLLGNSGILKSDSPSSDLLRSCIEGYGYFGTYSGYSDL